MNNCIKTRRIKRLQNPPTCQSYPYKQASIHYRTPFDWDFTCNDKMGSDRFIKFAGIEIE